MSLATDSHSGPRIGLSSVTPEETSHQQSPQTSSCNNVSSKISESSPAAKATAPSERSQEFVVFRTAKAQGTGAPPADTTTKAAESRANVTDASRPTHRRRASSIVLVKKIEPSQEEILDQSAGFNANANWVNYKGAWVIHVVLILFGKVLLDVIPGVPQDLSWTIVNLGYDALSFLMFHHVTGTPFDSNAGAYDQLTLWEQIDEGAQYTPAKKWLTSVPIGVFLVSTHYTRYNLALFALNFTVTLLVLFPKLPILHRLRFKVFPSSHSNFANGFNSPYPSRPNTPAVPESHSRGGGTY